MKIIQQISRILLGLVFTFSGVVKAIDPLGTGYKFQDYFEAMGLNWLMPMALTLSFILNAAELVIGLMLLFKTLPKLSYLLVLFILLLFTPLTLWLAIENPITDCGCFGDFLKMTNWQTFSKNIIFLLLLVPLLMGFRNVKTNKSILSGAIYTSVFVIFAFGFQFYNYKNLPIVDFRPYKIGASIPDGMVYPEGAPRDSFKTFLYYKNIETGVSEKFTDENYPWQDTLTYAFDTMMSELTFEGYHPPIHDFVLNLSFGEDITQKILKTKTYTFMLVAVDLEKVSVEQLNKTSYISDFCAKNGYKYYCITSSSVQEANKKERFSSADFTMLFADGKMLKTLIRSNPGLFILKDGVVIAKYAKNHFPDTKELNMKFIK